MAVRGEQKKRIIMKYQQWKNSDEFIDNVQNEWKSDAVKYLICVRTKNTGKKRTMKNHKIRNEKKGNNKR